MKSINILISGTITIFTAYLWLLITNSLPFILTQVILGLFIALYAVYKLIFKE